MSSARSTVSVDDDRVRVTTWTFGPGDTTGPHEHEYDYVVVPVTGGSFVVTTPDGGRREMTQQAASPYAGTTGTAHTVTAAGGSGETVSFVEVELKR
ncbi:MAG: cupin [Actinomycetes bacterium]